MDSFKLIVKNDSGLDLSSNNAPFQVDVTYSRLVQKGSADEGVDSIIVLEIVRAQLEKLDGLIELIDVVRETDIKLNFLAANGSSRLEKQVSSGKVSSLTINLNEKDVTIITEQDPQPESVPALAYRRAYFVQVGDKRLPFDQYQLQISPIMIGQDDWVKQGLADIFRTEKPVTSAVQLDDNLPTKLSSTLWTPFHVTIDGKFTFSLPQGSGDAWLWWLSGPISLIGIVLDNLAEPRTSTIPVPLPPFMDDVPKDSDAAVPFDVTESEIASNPAIFTEDAGAYCKPFANPERILGERSFSVIVRAEQPVISAEASVKKDPLHTLVFNPAVLANTNVLSSSTIERPDTIHTMLRARALDGETTSVVSSALPRAYIDVLNHVNRGRATLNAANPIQWEGDISRYQATTAVRGHIVEFRMRWRSNGYSFGNVAKTLTLVPRQTKRIQKIEFRRSELSRRQETTQLIDRVSDSVSREREYDDAIQSNLSEWARGESHSSARAGAVGFGFAAPGFVLGGGGAASNAKSESSQEGGRRVSASEEQRLRDSARRYGESLRKLDSIVVTEVTQEETTTGTTEVIRNPNYGHSLTVIYHQILRHLRVDTAVTGVRECVFVPLAITPFTIDRAYRWKEYIQKSLRDSKYSEAVNYLKDVWNNFADSDIPAGTRATQPIRYVYGSLFVKLAVERPRDKEDGTFDPNTWTIINPFLGAPALGIFGMLRTLSEAQRDASFQRNNAPTVAAKWVDALGLFASGKPIESDFTLATRYQFNNVARVDFTATIPAGINVTRDTLSQLSIQASSGLPPGSIANVQGITFTYQTDKFQHAVTVNQGVGDLVKPESGERDPGATFSPMLDDWERRDIRGDMARAVNGLIEHLNEHLEYYHKAIWWNMDRDRLFMLIDGFYCPGTNNVSIASVVERDPVAIIGNSLVYRVSAGSFLGLGSITTPQELLNYYIAQKPASEPLLISLPTDGLYAQSIMDECVALEEHYGGTDWVLSEPEPDLGQIAPELLMSRRTEPQIPQPTPLPPTLINLQNAPAAPDPSGLAGILQAVTSSNAFRDMAGLAGTQANAIGALNQAASLAHSFGQMAVDLQKSKQGTSDAKQKLSNIQKAQSEGLIDKGEAHRQSVRALDDQNTAPKPGSITSAEEVEKIVNTAGTNRADVTVKRPDGETVEARTFPQDLGNAPPNAPATWVDLDGNTPSTRTFSPETNDKSGIAGLQAAISNAPPGAKFQWTVNVPRKLQFSNPNAGATDIIAGESGVTTVSFEVQDANGNSLRIGHVWVGVPKFIRVQQYAGAAYASQGTSAANSHLFDTVLSEFHLTAQKDAVVQTAKLVCDYLLRKANVRTIWALAPFNEVLPAQFQPGGFAENSLSVLSIAGFTPAAASLGNIGATDPRNTILPTQGNIAIYPGGLDCGIFPQVKAILDEVKRLEQEVTAHPANAAIGQDLARVQDLWTEVVGRVIGVTMAHEIHHLILGPSPGLSPEGHTILPEIDLLSPGNQRKFLDYTGVETPDPLPTNFPAQGTYTDRGYNGILILDEENQARVDVLFPIPPAFPF